MQLIKRNISKISILKIPALIFLITFVPFFIQAAQHSQPALFEGTTSIETKAKIFLEEIANAADNVGIEVKINSLDPRLNLRKCDKDLDAFFPTGSRQMGKVTVAISCNTPVKWKVFVSGSLYEYAEVVVAKRTISRKSVINDNDLGLKRVNISKLRSAPIYNKKQAIGSTSKRQIRANSILFEGSVCMVCKGDNVTVVAKNQFIKINMEGVALSDAIMGEKTLIRNKQSKRTFSAKVIGKDHLEVTLTP